MFISFFGLKFLVEMSDSEGELRLSLMRNVTNKQAESDLQSRSKYVLTAHLYLLLKPAPHTKLQLRAKTLLSGRTFSTMML